MVIGVVAVVSAHIVAHHAHRSAAQDGEEPVAITGCCIQARIQLGLHRVAAERESLCLSVVPAMMNVAGAVHAHAGGERGIQRSSQSRKKKRCWRRCLRCR